MYHRRFLDRAVKCTHPCAWQGNHSGRHQLRGVNRALNLAAYFLSWTSPRASDFSSTQKLKLACFLSLPRTARGLMKSYPSSCEFLAHRHLRVQLPNDQLPAPIPNHKPWPSKNVSLWVRHRRRRTGSDFPPYFGLNVSMRHHRLVGNTTKLTVNGKLSVITPSGI